MVRDERYGYHVDYSLWAPLDARDSSDHAITTIDGQIVATDYDDPAAKRSVAGTFSGAIIRPDLAPGRSVVDLCDEDSQELYEFAAAVWDDDEGGFREDLVEFESGGILVLERCEVVPEHRGHGLGLRACWRFIHTFGGNCRVAVCHPTPIQKDGVRLKEGVRKAGARRLAKYWSRLGFKPVPNSEFYWMLLDSDSIPDADELLHPTKAKREAKSAASRTLKKAKKTKP